MNCAIHQPNYLPYPGFFNKVLNCDVFVIYDSVQFRKNNFQNRNRVCSPEGWQWLTIPVKHSFGQKINDVEIKNPQKALKNNWLKIQTLYGKAPYFNQFGNILRDIYSKNYNKLADINYDLIIAICGILNINAKFIRSSSLTDVQSKSTMAIIDICKSVNADTYISGNSGKNYLDMNLIEKSGINIIFQNFVQPVYKQFNNHDFQPNMSIIDLLFNCGSNKVKLLLT